MFESKIYSFPEKVMIDGVEGKKISYAFELEDGNFHGEMYFAAKDTGIATVLTFEILEIADIYHKLNADGSQ